MFPQSSIKRLQFAFASMAGLTLLALIVGCITFAFSHTAQQQFIEETTPLLIDVEQLSKAEVGFSSTARQLETIETRARLEWALSRYQARSDLLQKGLLGLAKHGQQKQVVQDLNEVVRELAVHEETYVEGLRAKIDTRTRLATLRREIRDQGNVLQDLLSPFVLENSLRMIDLAQGTDGIEGPRPDVLEEVLNEVQLMTNISFTAERFVLAANNSDTSNSTTSVKTLREELAPEFRKMTQLALKLRDKSKRQPIAEMLQIFNEKALSSGGIADQSERLGLAIKQLETLNQERTRLLTGMKDLIDEIDVDARNRFFADGEATQRRGLIAVSTLILLSTVTFAAVMWIGWRLINRDIAQRLHRLATSTVALASGDLDVAIDQSGSDELAEMARAAEIFRRNAQELRRTEAELADRLVDVERTNEKLIAVNSALDTANAGLAESELRYELAIGGSSVGIWDFDVRATTVFWSDRYKEIIGLKDDITRRDFKVFQERLHPDDRDRVSERFQNHLNNGDPYDVEYRLRHENGTYIWIHARGQAIWDDQGNPTRMTGSIDDISDRKLAAIELGRYAKELERSNRELDDFAYIASHDLKEPLRAIYNHASFLLEDYQDKLDEEGEKRLNRLIELSKRMEKLIADLLYFSRLGRGDQAMENVDLNKVIADVGAHLSETLTSRNGRVEVPERLPSISGQPAHITALFQNLISNGTKYNDAKERRIEIGLAPPPQNENSPSHETLYVRDNGIGIEERFQDEIFRIFKRLNSEKTYGEGTGAGLTFVKKIVENHGGDIWLESRPGEGTTFFFTLKRAA